MVKKAARVCVVGAGVSGLVAIRELVAEGHEVQAYEKTDDVIGNWRDVYESVQLLTSKRATAFKGYPMPDATPHFPTGQQYRDYIRWFAKQSGLLRYIRFNTAVVAAVPVDGGTHGWDVTLSDGTTQRFDALVAAHGHLWAPKIPKVEGKFDGPMLHTSQYRNPGDMVGETVLVVGSGNSACDMVTDAIASGRQALMSLRHPTWFVPQSFFGTPRADLTYQAYFPGSSGDELNHLMVKMSVGEPSSYGFPQPSDENWTAKPPTFSTLVPYWAQRGRVKAVPQIARFDGRKVVFVDDTSAEVGTVIWATGYKAPVPFLSEGSLTYIGDFPARKVGGLLSADFDNFYFSGMCSPRGGAPHNYGRGAETLAKLVTARFRLGKSLSTTVFADDAASGRMDWLLAHWVVELEAAEAKLRERVSNLVAC
ncbi:NAD(P)-binding domain-containing protein [Mesorhizobium sp. AR10]|uniref:flavin-containing monooxygenase n=1 Tax=Mesorhizobium sp. AR10 TaxID=2865839 RepID=UPI00215E79AA|nr:NAD(P)-binding domain-containing protein [Mesorhizobium sp. AR10]UVK37881.1 NAD(P)-binding domain-containing protein [Mesorhizobium sp. AR10]